ncbi:MAG: hypothetical protein HQK54_18230, partial [Oligoflexales bacterium]|nr:hypothetical protein [Oligoflexales bacterium]
MSTSQKQSIFPPLAFFLQVCFLLAGCQGDDQGESRVMHDPGRFANDLSGYQWITADDALYREMVAAGMYVYPKDHPMAGRLQAWPDRLFDTMQAASENLSARPRPVLKILQSPKANAFVSQMPVCVDIRAAVGPSGPAAEKGSGGGNYLNFRRDSGQASSSPRGPDCISFSGDDSRKRDFVGWTFSRMPGCGISDEVGNLRLSGECVGGKTHLYSESYLGFRIFPTLNYISILSGTFNRLDEQQTVS